MPFPPVPSRPDPTQVVAAVVILLGALLFGTAGTLSAQAPCGGDVGVEFSDVQLLHTDSGAVAGPFSIQLAAGTYDVSTLSYDPHSTQAGASDQPMEQWRFALDSGFTSPFTSDIPLNADEVSDTWYGLRIDESTSLTLHHHGVGGVNSVWPRCISFHRVDTPDLESTPQPPASDPDLEPGDATTEVTVAPEATVTPEATVAPEATVTPEVEVQGVIEERPSTATSSSATSSSATSSTADSSTAASPSLDSAQQIPPVLALTGPTKSQQFAILALALLAVGTGLMAAASLKQLVDELEESSRARRH